MNEKLKFAEKKELSEDDYITMLSETCTSMEFSLKNLEVVIGQQERLHKVVEDANDDEFKTFLKDLAENTVEMKEQLETLKDRSSQLHFVLSQVEESSNAKHAVISLIKAFGIFAQ